VDVGRIFVGLVALLLAPTGFASAQKPESPPSQAAFRAFLTQFQEKSDREKDAAAFGALEQARAPWRKRSTSAWPSAAGCSS
jgi:hypothetical protein